jgi:hypothetical protein
LSVATGNVEHARHAAESTAAIGFLCAQGNPGTIHLEVRQATITTVLSAMRASYNISYRSSIALDETRDGAYAGSLTEIISYLLSNYDYVIEENNAALDIEIFGRSGGAVPAPAVLAVEKSERPGPRVARVR